MHILLFIAFALCVQALRTVNEQLLAASGDFLSYGLQEAHKYAEQEFGSSELLDWQCKYISITPDGYLQIIYAEDKEVVEQIHLINDQRENLSTRPPSVNFESGWSVKHERVLHGAPALSWQNLDAPGPGQVSSIDAVKWLEEMTTAHWSLLEIRYFTTYQILGTDEPRASPASQPYYCFNVPSGEMRSRQPGSDPQRRNIPHSPGSMCIGFDGTWFYYLGADGIKVGHRQTPSSPNQATNGGILRT